MGDIPTPPLAATSSNNEMALDISERSAASPAGSDKTITPSSSALAEPQLGHGSAMFSTDLGRRAPRKLRGPPYTPVIVRSDIVQGVVFAAGVWRSKYPYQYLCIFPQANWQIDDLWDEEDIHLDTEPFCKEVLQFIQRDNYVRAQKYAQDWSKMQADRLATVGGDMTDFYDKNNPLSIVPKIFVNEEVRDYPPIFLWHVAHIMRTALLAVKGTKLPVEEAVATPERPELGHQGPVVHGITQASSTAHTATMPVDLATRANVIRNVPKSAASMSTPLPIPTWQSDRTPVPFLSDGPSPQGGLYADPIEGGRCAGATGHTMTSASGHQMSDLNSMHSGLRVPRTRPGRSSSGTYNQTAPSGSYVENMSRVPSGSSPRQNASCASIMPSPRFNQAPMAMNHTIVNVSQGMASFTYEQNLMASGVVPSQSLHHGILHLGMVPLHTIQTPSIAHGYARQLSGSQGPLHAAPMADTTNMHYPPNMPPQNIDPRHAGDRRYSQQHSSGALYDPYEGGNPAFKAAGYSNSKKNNQNSFQGSNGRQRKTSFPGSRPYYTQYTNNGSGLPQPSGHRYPGSKGYREDDLAIVQDREHGCHIDWIGPQNITVDELFVKDLPGNIQDTELEALFHDGIGVKPTSVNIGIPFHTQHNLQTRKHAFVGFPTAAVARQAISIRNPTIRGLPVPITVPKRFFQKIVEVPLRDAIEAGPSAYSRYTSNPKDRESRSRIPLTNNGSDVIASATANKGSLSYSPQDARSDMHKKKKGKQPQQNLTATGSPEARKTKPKKRQQSPAEEKPTEKPTVRDDTLHQETKTDDDVLTVVKAKETCPALQGQIEQPQANEDTSSKSNEQILPKGTAGASAGNGVSGFVDASDAANIGSYSAADHQKIIPHQAKRQAPQETHKVEPHVKSSELSPAKHTNGAKETALESTLPNFFDVKDVSNETSKNDTSFYSAAQSQSDLEAKVEPSVDAVITNQGTTTLSSNITEPSTTDYLPPPHPVSIGNTGTVNILESAAAKEQLSIPDSKATAMSPNSSKQVDDSAATPQETAPSTTSIAEPTKKGKTQHTESLHPFSKVSKAQLKKEREQKRKAQKKEKELVERLRATKASASKVPAKSASAEDSEFTRESDAAGSIVTSSNKKDVVESEPVKRKKDVSSDDKATGVTSPHKDSAPAAEPSKGVDDNCDRPGKRKGQKADTTAANGVAMAENEDDDHGKQTGGTISIPNETGSVTKKDMKFHLPEDGMALDAQSSEQTDAKDVSTHVTMSSTAETTEAGLAKSGKKKNKKKKKKTPQVWPSLEFRVRSPNPSWMGKIDMETDTRNYDELINKACGGEEDSDFSWDDLPRMDSPSLDGDGGGSDNDYDDQDRHALEKRIADLEAQRAAVKETLSGSAVTNALRSETPQGSTASEEGGHERIAALERHIAASTEDMIAATVDLTVADEQLAHLVGTQTSSVAVAIESPPAKKKKPNKHRNKKKKQQQLGTAAESTETPEASTSDGNMQTTDNQEQTSGKETEKIDNSDPFYDQLKGIDAIKRGDYEAANAPDTPSQQHAEIVKPLVDPHFMRTMEGYLKETQGRSQSKARKVSKEDLLYMVSGSQ